MTDKRELTDFGKELLKLAIDRGMVTVAELAKKLGVTAKTINPIIYGENPVNINFINAVIDALQLKATEEAVLLDAAYECMNVLEIRTSALSAIQKELAILIVQKIEMLNDETAKQMIEAISNINALSELVKEGEAMAEYATSIMVDEA